MIETVIQAAITLLSGAAIWLVSRKEHWRRWGYILGLLSQPLWLYVTYEAKQWGMFTLSVWYTYSWIQGVWNYWFFPQEE